jgi:hypothetical protein
MRAYELQCPDRSIARIVAGKLFQEFGKIIAC